MNVPGSSVSGRAVFRLSSIVMAIAHVASYMCDTAPPSIKLWLFVFSFLVVLACSFDFHEAAR